MPTFAPPPPMRKLSPPSLELRDRHQPPPRAPNLYATKIRYMGICDIICSVFMITGSLISIAFGFSAPHTVKAEEHPPIMQPGAAGLGFVGLVLYVINITFACVLLSAAQSVTRWKVVLWLSTQVAGVLYTVAYVAFYCFVRVFYGALSVIATIPHGVGIIIAVLFIRDNGRRRRAVVPIMPSPSVTVIVTQVEGDSIRGSRGSMGSQKRDSTSNPFKNSAM